MTDFEPTRWTWSHFRHQFTNRILRRSVQNTVLFCIVQTITGDAHSSRMLTCTRARCRWSQIVDDLRPVMKVAYKQDYMITPAFDKLANESLVFSRAFCEKKHKRTN